MANERARRLRKTMTRQEATLWKRLREFREEGFRFRRQVPLDGYILDFVCFGSRLVVVEHALPQTAAAPGVKLARGKFSAPFFLAALVAIGAEIVRLEDI